MNRFMLHIKTNFDDLQYAPHNDKQNKSFEFLCVQRLNSYL